MKEEKVDLDKRQLTERRGLAIFVGIVAIILGVNVLAVCIRVCTKKESARDMGDLINQDLQEDILFVGDSQVNFDILPMELWQKYGYTSYVLHANNNGIARSRAMLQLALQYSNPKVVVLSTDQYWEESSIDTQIASYHEYADDFPLTATKIKSTFQWLQEPSQRAEILFPFLIYHNRWKELTRGDFYMKGSVLKGAALSYSISPIDFQDKPATDEPIMPENGERNLIEIEKFIQECQDRNIDVLLLTLPMGLSTKRQSYLYELEEVADRYNIQYLNLVEDCTIVDGMTDFKDAVHLNVSGAKKLTAYLGQYLQEHYNLQNRMLDSDTAALWNEDLEEYLELKKQELINTQDIQSFLLQCRDENLDIALYIKWNSNIYKDDQSCRLIENIAHLEKLDEARQAGEDYFSFVDFGKGVIYETVALQEEALDTSIGKIRVACADDGNPELFCASNEKNWFAQEGDREGDVRIAVFNRWTGEAICIKIFDTQMVLKSEIDEEIKEK